MKLIIIPLFLLLLIGCETKKSVVNNYYNDGLYTNESYSSNKESTLEENKKLSYYQPRNNPRKPQNNRYITGGGTTINNFYNYPNYSNTGLYFRRFNVYYPWRRHSLYSWRFQPLRWESGFFHYSPFSWYSNIQRINSYNLGYIHGLNNFHSRNISLVSPLSLRERTGSYGSRGYKTTQRYNRSRKTSFNSRMGGRTFQRKKSRSNRKTPIRFSDNTNRNETSTPGKYYFGRFHRPTKNTRKNSSLGISSDNKNKPNRTTINDWKPKTKRRSRRIQKDVRPNVRPSIRETYKKKRRKIGRKNSPKTGINFNRNRTNKRRYNPKKNKMPSRGVSPNRSSIRRGGSRKTIRRNSRASRRR